MEESSPTPKKKVKIASSTKGSREPTPKKASVVPAENEEEVKTERLPRNQKQLEKLLNKVKQKLAHYKNVFFQEQKDLQGFHSLKLYFI